MTPGYWSERKDEFLGGTKLINPNSHTLEKLPHKDGLTKDFKAQDYITYVVIIGLLYHILITSIPRLHTEKAHLLNVVDKNFV